jgi:hypothetical protein
MTSAIWDLGPIVTAQDPTGRHLAIPVSSQSAHVRLKTTRPFFTVFIWYLGLWA